MQDGLWVVSTWDQAEKQPERKAALQTPPTPRLPVR